MTAYTSSTPGTGYPESNEAESPLYNFVSGVSTTDTQLTFSFDYSVAAGDSLYAHVWAVTGVSDFDGQFIANTEGSANGNISSAGADSDELTTYSLLNGAESNSGAIANSISGLLTGVGNFSTTIDVSTLGIAGVSDVGDINYFVIAFTKDEDGTAGVTSLDNVSLVSVIPEPASAGVLGFLALSFTLVGRRRAGV